MLERRSGRFAVILEQQDVAEAAVVLEIEHAVTISPQNFLDSLLRQRGHGELVVRRLDNYFVRANAIHAIE